MNKMISLQTLLDMVATEGIEGGARDHYFDTERNREFVPEEPERTYPPHRPIRYGLELIEKPDGSYEWVEE